MPSKTINTEIKKLVEKNKKLSTGVNDVEYRITDNSLALVMDKKSALELAGKIIAFAHILEEDSRINLTTFKDKRGVTITSY